MAKFERTITGDFDDVLDRLHQGVLEGSSSTSYEDGSDYTCLLYTSDAADEL